MFKNLPIRYKLLLNYSIVLAISLPLGSGLIYAIVRNNIRANIESELKNTTEAILSMVKTSADVSIKNHLRAVAEKNREIVQFFYDKCQAGQLSESTAKQEAAQLLLTQTIGTSGYIYCIDSFGTLKVHPAKEFANVNMAGFENVRYQMENKEGYLEYQWKNPNEPEPRPKALYMTWFKPWDWIISVSCYRREFKDLINVDDFKETILGFRFGRTGYSFVIDNQGRAIIHPQLQGVNVLEDGSLPNESVASMLRLKKGKIIYPWNNPGEVIPREKLVIFNYIPEYEWIVASSSYLDEFYRPLTTIRNLMFITVGVSFVLILAFTFKISSYISNPLKKLMEHFHHVRESNFTLRMESDSRDEIGQLADHFNEFMEQLEKYSHDLNNEITNRKKAEIALRESEGRYRSVMEAAPDPIVVYNMKGEVIFFNPAFTRVFGWSLTECLGKKMDFFVPEENWPETRMMIDKILAGQTLSDTETCRYNKPGHIIPVTISGATFWDFNGHLAGSVIILRDITIAKRLRKQIMDLTETERQRMGQDLHDDLCPHLIGVQGLSAVLETNLREESSPHTRLAANIATFIGEAIEKARALARGLCPVHLVSHGLYTALDDLAARTEITFGCTCRFAGDESIDLKDNLLATHLYFIAQEAVANAVKHAVAREIDLSFSRTENTLRLTIQDDGRGFSQHQPLKGIGLQIMEYRAKMIGAVMEVDSRVGRGTTIRISLKTKNLNRPDGS